MEMPIVDIDGTGEILTVTPADDSPQTVRMKLTKLVLEQLTDVRTADGVVTWAKRLETYVTTGE